MPTEEPQISRFVGPPYKLLARSGNIARGGCARSSHRRERPLHRVPDRSAVQLSPGRREDGTKNRGDWNSDRLIIKHASKLAERPVFVKASRDLALGSPNRREPGQNNRPFPFAVQFGMCQQPWPRTWRAACALQTSSRLWASFAFDVLRRYE